MSESASPGHHDDIIYPETIPFLLIHLACFAAIWTGVTPLALGICVALYVIRMFGVTAGYHRYFSHRSFKAGRIVQFLLACLAQTTAQRGVLWWAAKHRHHHRHSDTPEDVHSPMHRGFWYSHWAWVYDRKHDATNYDAVQDLTKYPELVWLNRWQNAPAIALALVCFLVEGWPGLVVGFVWSTVLVYHGTFMINSVAHVAGSRRYVTGDDSRNNWLLALVTLGEGWHNNHHAYPRSTRQGFRWWEIDPTYYALKTLSWCGIVRDLGVPPADLVRNERPLGRALQEKVARQLAASFPVEQIAAQLRDAWAHTPTLHELRERVAAGQARAEVLLAELSLPHIPSAAEMRARAEEMFAATPSLEEVVSRAREIVLQSLALRLQPQLGAPGGG